MSDNNWINHNIEVNSRMVYDFNMIDMNDDVFNPYGWTKCDDSCAGDRSHQRRRRYVTMTS